MTYEGNGCKSDHTCVNARTQTCEINEEVVVSAFSHEILQKVGAEWVNGR